MTEALETSKSQRAYDWIREQIAIRRFGPGYRLVLSSLAGELSMSVVPVREAIRRLSAEGLITFEPNLGARVAVIDAVQYRFSTQVISVVESAATALSAPHLTPADIARAREVNELMRQSLRDVDPRAFRTRTREFHRILYGRCPNPRLIEIVEAEWARLGNLRDSAITFVPGRAPASICEHDELLDLIESGADPVELERAARRHRETTLNAYLTTTEGASDAAR